MEPVKIEDLVKEATAVLINGGVQDFIISVEVPGQDKTIVMKNGYALNVLLAAAVGAKESVESFFDAPDEEDMRRAYGDPMRALIWNINRFKEESEEHHDRCDG